MAKLDAIRVAGLMTSSMIHLAGLSPHTKAALKRAGFDTVAKLWDALVGNYKIVGVSEIRRIEIGTALEAAGLPLRREFHRDSHQYIAHASYQIGAADGKAEAERVALNQVIRFKAVQNFSVGQMKDKMLEAYGRKVPYIGFEVILEYEVPGIGSMICPHYLVMSVDGMNKMTREWNPTVGRPVSGSTILKMGDIAPRDCDITMNLGTCSGTLFVKPPTQSALERFTKTFGTGA